MVPRVTTSASHKRSTGLQLGVSPWAVLTPFATCRDLAWPRDLLSGVVRIRGSLVIVANLMPSRPIIGRSVAQPCWGRRMLMARVLFPADFSERSHAAARYVRALVCHFQSELNFLHVIEPRAQTGRIVETQTARARHASPEESLQNFLAGEFQEYSVRRIIRSGDPAHNIVNLAHSEDATLIVMPTQLDHPRHVTSVIPKQCEISGGSHTSPIGGASLKP
jgi:nucleotide-binding universal stress UspA family protein